MLSTDLVPVHNDIWRRLPFSSWRDFKPYHKPLLWRRQCLKGLNTDPEVFLSTFLPPVWHGKPQVFSYTQPPLHWSDHFYLSLPGVLEQYQGFGSMSSVAIEVVSAPLHFLHKEGSNNPRVYLDTDTGISFIWPAPRDKTGGGGGHSSPKHLSALALLHTVRRRTSTPQKWQNHGCYQMQQRLRDDGRGG